MERAAREGKERQLVAAPCCARTTGPEFTRHEPTCGATFTRESERAANQPLLEETYARPAAPYVPIRRYRRSRRFRPRLCRSHGGPPAALSHRELAAARALLVRAQHRRCPDY